MIELRVYTERDERIFLEHLEKAFLDIEGKDNFYKITLPRFSNPSTRGHLIVASLDNQIAGFGGYEQVCNNQFIRENLEGALGWIGQDQRILLEYMKRARDDLGKGEATATIYDNDLTKINPSLNENDFYCSISLVLPEFRRRGIGLALVNERIKRARRESATAIYTECWEYGNASKMYTKAGFSPILRAGPRYNDGSAQMLMGLILQ